MSAGSAWTIRAGVEADIPSLLALWRRAGGVASGTDSEEAIRRLLEQDPGSLQVAEAGGDAIGSLIAGWDGWRGSFYRLAVDRRWRRRGLATALVRAGEDRLRSLGAIRLTAVVSGEEPPALAFWAAMGYDRQLDMDRFIRMLEG
jgi:ribosomal protein S18 acetylase RimI-like enzyme